MWTQGYPKQDDFSSLPFYLTGIGRHDLQPPIYRPDGLARHQFLYASQGSGKLIVQDKEIEIPPNCGFYLPAGMPHEYYPETSEWNIRWISCGGTGLEPLCKNLQIIPARPYHLLSVQPLDDILEDMRQTAVLSLTNCFYKASSYVNLFIVTFCIQAGILADEHMLCKGDIYSLHKEMLEYYIEQNYMRDIPLEELCHLLSVTPQHLCRVFRKSMGKRPTEYINEIRLHHVMEYLSGSDYPITQIAAWCGFQSAGYMGRLFRKETGMSPKEYRSHSTFCRLPLSGQVHSTSDLLTP